MRLASTAIAGLASAALVGIAAGRASVDTAWLDKRITCRYPSCLAAHCDGTCLDKKLLRHGSGLVCMLPADVGEHDGPCVTARYRNAQQCYLTQPDPHPDAPVVQPAVHVQQPVSDGRGGHDRDMIEGQVQ